MPRPPYPRLATLVPVIAVSVVTPCIQCARVMRAAADRAAVVTLALRKATTALHEGLGHKASTVRSCGDAACVERMRVLDGTVDGR